MIINNRNNIIFADIPNNSSIISPSTTDIDKKDEYESIFGPNVTRTQEIIYVVLIIVAVICMVSVVAFATVRKCTRKRNGATSPRRSSDDKTVPYAPVNNGHQRGVSSSVVNYVDERPGNHDIHKLQQANMPLTASYSPQNNRNSLINKTQGGTNYVDENDDGTTEVGIAMTTTTQQMNENNNNNNDNNIQDPNHLSPNINQNGNDNREESISAMSI